MIEKQKTCLVRNKMKYNVMQNGKKSYVIWASENEIEELDWLGKTLIKLSKMKKKQLLGEK